MNLDISLVPYGQIGYTVPSLLRYFNDSENWSRGRSNVDDIIKFILTGQMQLWVVFEPSNMSVHGYVMTELKDYPQKKMLVIQYCAMAPHLMKYVEDNMHEKANTFARHMGCGGIEFFGRPGWEPHVKKRGYTVKTVIFEKHFDEVIP